MATITHLVFRCLLVYEALVLLPVEHALFPRRTPRLLLLPCFQPQQLLRLLHLFVGGRTGTHELMRVGYSRSWRIMIVPATEVGRAC